jgi:hypothetical protein
MGDELDYIEVLQPGRTNGFIGSRSCAGMRLFNGF